ncbi:SinI anti-repressor domain-containing protein [Priestia aryabhattai]|nr:SinI anti-repressor domain-containing protein [Priestia aryabhattai]
MKGTGMMSANDKSTIDLEWVHLMLKAQDQGISIQDVKEFISNPNQFNKKEYNK